MTNKRKEKIRELAANLGVSRRVAASRLDASRLTSRGPALRSATNAAPTAYAGPRGEAAPPVALRDLWACAAAGVVTCDGDSGAWSLVESPPSGAPAELVARVRSAPYLEAMEKNNWAVEARHALAQIGRDIATAFADSVRRGAPTLCPSTAPTPPRIPPPGKRVPAVDLFRTDPGWRSILFSMSHPVFFQYRIDAGDRAFTATARGRRREKDGSKTDVTLVFRGRLDDSDVLWTSPIEESWIASPPSSVREPP